MYIEIVLWRHSDVKFTSRDVIGEISCNLKQTTIWDIFREWYVYNIKNDAHGVILTS
jgi:hypothetical protein